MKIALLGDVHANLPALEAVLDHAKRQGIGAIWNIGDFVGYGAFPDEVIKRLRHEGAMSIIGNYDLKVLRFPKKKEKWKNSKHPHKFFAFQWAYENLSEESRRYLTALPKQIRLDGIGDMSILITHGSPISNEESLTPETPEERLRELAQIAQADMVIFGHSHRHFTRRVDGVWFINTGTVGRPDEGDPRACYAILDVHKNEFQVEHYFIEYDIQRAVAAIREKGLPEVFTEMIQEGYDLNTILGEGT